MLGKMKILKIVLQSVVRLCVYVLSLFIIVGGRTMNTNDPNKSGSQRAQATNQSNTAKQTASLAQLRWRVV